MVVDLNGILDIVGSVLSAIFVFIGESGWIGVVAIAFVAMILYVLSSIFAEFIDKNIKIIAFILIIIVAISILYQLGVAIDAGQMYKAFWDNIWKAIGR